MQPTTQQSRSPSQRERDNDTVRAGARQLCACLCKLAARLSLQGGGVGHAATSLSRVTGFDATLCLFSIQRLTRKLQLWRRLRDLLEMELLLLAGVGVADLPTAHP